MQLPLFHLSCLDFCFPLLFCVLLFHKLDVFEEAWELFLSLLVVFILAFETVEFHKLARRNSVVVGSIEVGKLLDVLQLRNWARPGLVILHVVSLVFNVFNVFLDFLLCFHWEEHSLLLGDHRLKSWQSCSSLFLFAFFLTLAGKIFFSP